MLETIADAFSNWYAARDQLEHAVDSFLGACTTLHQFIDQPPASCKDLGSIEDYVLKIHAQIGSIVSIATKATRSTAILRRVINTSTTLVPISVLPPEVLSRVFELTLSSNRSVLGSPNRREHPLAVIPAVCTQWRGLALDTRSLWSHVDVDGARLVSGGTIKELKRINMWLDRAHGAALHINFHSSPSDPRLVSIVQPHLTRMTSLAFHPTRGGAFLEILNTFASCSSGMLTTLSAVYSVVTSHGDIWEHFPEIMEDANTPHLPWPTAALHGLVHLELVGLPHKFCLDLDELASILSNSPGLQTLPLRIVEIAPSQHGHHPRIHIPNLRMLDISLRHNLALQNPLSLLMPGERELDVRIEMPDPDNHACSAAIRALFQCSNVTQFTAWSVLPNSSAQLAGYLDCLPKLRTLILDGSWEGGSCTSLAALVVKEQGKIRARCPYLQELALLSAEIGSDAQDQLKLIVSTH
ncbi:hypothetical protein FRC08_008481, partial [Ceratobasidium sp. 394]